MTLRSLQSAVALAVLSVPAVSFAQSQTSANEDERLEALIRESEMVYVPQNTVTIGFRVLSSGPKTSFSGLGNVPTRNVIPPASEGAKNRIYDDGAVGGDAVRANEKDADGNQKTPDANGRYQTYATVKDEDGVESEVLTGDYISYVDGLSRSWSYSSDEQATMRPGYIGMSNYSASANSGTAFKEQGMTAGVELQVARMITKPGRRIQLGLVAGVSLSDINNKTSGSVLATLTRETDYYSLNGRPVPPRGETSGYYVGPSFEDILDDEGEVLVPGGRETTTPISQTPSDSDSETIVDGATIDGYWQVKGNYFLVRLGPLVRTQITDRIGISASLGVAGAYAGTRFTSIESFKVPGTEQIIGGVAESSHVSKFLSGYYADVNVEFTANDRTGFFGGLTAQQFGEYSQTLGGRTATIDLGNAVGLRGGVSVKF
jgi:hypothetical protein